MDTGDLNIEGTVTGLTKPEITTALGYTPSKQATSPTAGNLATVDSDGNVTDSGKQSSTDGTMADNSDNEIPTQKAIVTYVNSQVLGNLDGGAPSSVYITPQHIDGGGV